jgi:hypothetical protein
MNTQRFDTLAKSMAGRLSRRGALRGAGAAASAGLLASAGIRPARAVARTQTDGQPIYTMVRRYTLDGDTSAVRQQLEQGYVAAICQAPGFIAYFTVEDGDGTLVTVAVFRAQQDFESFANDEANWIAQNLSDLPSPDEAIEGQTYIYAGDPQAFTGTCPGAPQPTSAPGPTTTPGAPTATAAPSAPTATAAAPTPTPCTGQGCPCTTGTQSPCDDGLICCATTTTPGGPGTCQTEAACEPACTGEGCACQGGVQGACDDGLVCCQDGQEIPGGSGTCTAEANCAPTPCTGEGCACTGGVEGACDPGLVCCLNGVPVIGGTGGCVAEAQCPAPGGTPVS